MSTVAGQIASGTLTSAATGTVLYQPLINTIFNIFITGTFSATVVVARSYDGGATFVPLATPTLSGVATFTVPITFECLETDSAVLWTVSAATALGGSYTSGTVSYRIG